MSGRMAAMSDRRPLLVTGVPRSGTTWAARLLATAPGTALAGREPMNPRGRQYALGGTVAGWVRLTEPTPRQQRVLTSTYAGRNPRTYGRYGRHQWRGPLPSTRLVVKDPFAMLSTPAIAAVTRARALQVYRHPGAVLTSYRRMGWRPDLDEIAPFIPEAATHFPELGEAWDRGVDALSDAERMGVFWGVLQALALADLDAAPGALFVAHHELAGGGMSAVTTLFTELGLRPTAETEREMTGGGDAPASSSGSQLHQLHRSPAEVAESWRAKLDADEVVSIERITADVLAAVDARRLSL